MVNDLVMYFVLGALYGVFALMLIKVFLGLMGDVRRLRKRVRRQGRRLRRLSAHYRYHLSQHYPDEVGLPRRKRKKKKR